MNTKSKHYTEETHNQLYLKRMLLDDLCRGDVITKTHINDDFGTCIIGIKLHENFHFPFYDFFDIQEKTGRINQVREYYNGFGYENLQTVFDARD